MMLISMTDGFSTMERLLAQSYIDSNQDSCLRQLHQEHPVRITHQRPVCGKRTDGYKKKPEPASVSNNMQVLVFGYAAYCVHWLVSW
ncbi:MAG: hypothetical protein J6K73_15985 [Clostridia bacterium]|nr:hypothetical protein [Clostridia bacterium]